LALLERLPVSGCERVRCSTPSITPAAKARKLLDLTVRYGRVIDFAAR